MATDADNDGFRGGCDADDKVPLSCKCDSKAASVPCRKYRQRKMTNFMELQHEIEMTVSL